MTDRSVAQWIGLFCLLMATAAPRRHPITTAISNPIAAPDSPEAIDGAQVEFGKPNKRLDRIARVVGMPARIIGLNKKINNHDVSLETLSKLRTYLDQNDLADVTIYVNGYEPKEQWHRLKENTRVGAGWRYSLGTLSMVGYTLSARPRVWRRQVQPLYQQPVHQFRRPGDRPVRSGLCQGHSRAQKGGDVCRTEWAAGRRNLPPQP